MEDKKNNKKTQAVIEDKQQANDMPKKTIINCLRNEKVNVVFLERTKGFPVSKQSPLYGGLADTSVKVFTVPILQKSGKLANPLTDEEKDCLESIMGLEENALSIYHKPCYWSTSTKGATNKVRLTKEGKTLDLSNPEDYIEYKILLLNKETICPSWDEWIRNPKPSYIFVLRHEGSEVEYAGNKVQLVRECNRLFDKYAENASVLRCILENVEGRRMSPNTKIEILQGRCLDYISNKPSIIADSLKDPLIEFKAFIIDCVDKHVISNRNNMYYITEGNKPICEDYENPTMGNAAKFLSNPKNQDIYFNLQSKIA